jgi:hypothetical protein
MKEWVEFFGDVGSFIVDVDGGSPEAENSLGAG